MIVYSGTKSRFRQDVMTNDIGGIIFDTLKAVTGHSAKHPEIDSRTNSLQYMDRMLGEPAQPDSLIRNQDLPNKACVVAGGA